MFARFSNPRQSGTETYVYMVRPNGVVGKVRDLQLSDARGVTLQLETGTRYYEVRIATDLSSTARTGFLGIDGYVKVDYKVKP